MDNRRCYPALTAYRDAFRAGIPYGPTHPISLAAAHEANARELDAQADVAPSAISRATWRREADLEMTAAERVLAHAERRATAWDARG